MRFTLQPIVRRTALTAITAFAVIPPAHADTNQMISTSFGAALGGLIGSQVAHGETRLITTAAGVFIGGAVGNSMGRPTSYYPSYPSRQYVYAAPRAVYYPPIYETNYYVPNYVAAPEPPPQPTTYVDDVSGDYCREYSQQVRIGNRVQESYGTACLQPDGSWRIISQ